MIGIEIPGDPLPLPFEARWPITAGRSRIGEVTVAVHSPRLETTIGYAMVGIDHAALGTRLDVEAPWGTATAVMAEKPLLAQPDRLASPPVQGCAIRGMARAELALSVLGIHGFERMPGYDRLMDGAIGRHNVRVSGRDGAQPVLFAHGFGCDSNMWRHVAPHFEDRYRVVLFDYIGHGGSDGAAYDAKRYSTLRGYSADVLDICRELDLNDVIFVGHSVSAMIGVLAMIEEGERFARLVMIGPSPCYLDADGYRGGFSREDIAGLLESLESNYLGWSSTMAPLIMGNPDRPELGDELTNSFCRVDPEIARSFAVATFLSDNRDDLAAVSVPTLILQCSDDVIAPQGVGEFVHQRVPGSRLVLLRATGHCPNLSAPEETIAAIEAFLAA